MKPIIKITLLMTVAVAVLAACQSNSGLTAPAQPDVAISDEYPMVETRGIGQIVDELYPSWPGRNVEAEMVRITNDIENLYVMYYLREEWQMNGSHIHVGESLADLPRDDRGFPIADRFRFGSSPDRGINPHIEVLPLSQLGVGIGDEILVVTNARLSQNGANRNSFQTSLENDGSRGSQGPEWWTVSRYRLRLSTHGKENAGRVKLTEDLSLILPN